MIIPPYEYSLVPKLNHTQIPFILLYLQFMFLKFFFSLLNLKTSGQTDPEMESTYHTHLTIIPTYHLCSTHNLVMCLLNSTIYTIMNLKLAKGMNILNHCGNTNTNLQKKLFNYANLMIYKQNHQVLNMVRFILALQIRHQMFLLNDRVHQQKKSLQTTTNSHRVYLILQWNLRLIHINSTIEMGLEKLPNQTSFIHHFNSVTTLLKLKIKLMLQIQLPKYLLLPINYSICKTSQTQHTIFW